MICVLAVVPKQGVPDRCVEVVIRDSLKLTEKNESVSRFRFWLSSEEPRNKSSILVAQTEASVHGFEIMSGRGFQPSV